MCYPKPGPRCSAHASQTLTLAKQKLANVNLGDIEGRLKIRQSVEKAQKEYDMTPAGMKELERRIIGYKNNKSACQEYKERLKQAQSLRTAKLAVINQDKDLGDIEHPLRASGQYGLVDFPENTADRLQVNKQDASVTKMIKESGKWLSKISPDEIEALSWMTSNGSGAVNTYLSSGNTTDGPFTYTKEHLENTINNVDTALSKFERRNPIIVYRGHTMIGASGEELDTADALEKLTVGSTYSNDRFSSASLDPSRAAGFTSSVIFEIKSRKAAPLINVSAWDLAEKEMLIPRNQQYKVVKHIHNPVINGKTKTGRVLVQLEEI